MPNHSIDNIPYISQETFTYDPSVYILSVKPSVSWDWGKLQQPENKLFQTYFGKVDVLEGFQRDIKQLVTDTPIKFEATTPLIDTHEGVGGELVRTSRRAQRGLVTVNLLSAGTEARAFTNLFKRHREIVLNACQPTYVPPSAYRGSPATRADAIKSIDEYMELMGDTRSSDSPIEFIQLEAVGKDGDSMVIATGWNPHLRFQPSFSLTKDTAVAELVFDCSHIEILHGPNPTGLGESSSLLDFRDMVP